MRAILAFLAILLAPAFASAQILYGATGGAVASDLYSINTTTGAATVIGPIGNGVTGMSLHPTTGVMYGVTTTTACSRCLITIDLTTGAGTVVGPLGLIIAEIEFRADGTLFGWSESSDELASINITTGAATTIPGSGIGTAGDGMVFQGGQLYVMGDSSTGDYHTVNTATGVATLVGTLSGSAANGNVSAATTQPGTGTQFISINAAGGMISTVNLTTGVITDIGVAVGGIDALAFGPGAPIPGLAFNPVPTLSEWMLVFLGLLTLTAGAMALRSRGLR